MGGGADLDGSVGAVLRGEEGPGLERPVDRLTCLGQVPAVVEDLEEPGTCPA